MILIMAPFLLNCKTVDPVTMHLIGNVFSVLHQARQLDVLPEAPMVWNVDLG